MTHPGVSRAAGCTAVPAARRVRTVGILIAVFAMRLLFPVVIVAISAKVGPVEAVALAIDDPDRYENLVTDAHPAITASRHRTRRPADRPPGRPMRLRMPSGGSGGPGSPGSPGGPGSPVGPAVQVDEGKARTALRKPAASLDRRVRDGAVTFEVKREPFRTHHAPRDEIECE